MSADQKPIATEPTEAQRKLVEKIVSWATPLQVCAQLIADSERAAVQGAVKIRESAIAFADKEIAEYRIERDQLRAEVTHLKACQNRGEYAERFNADLKGKLDKLRAEVERLTEINANLAQICAERTARMDKAESALIEKEKLRFAADAGRRQLRCDLTAEREKTRVLTDALKSACFLTAYFSGAFGNRMGIVDRERTSIVHAEIRKALAATASESTTGEVSP